MLPLIPSILLSTVATATYPANLSPPVLFPKGATVNVIQGVKVSDPYRALENGDDPEVQAWSDAQNVRTRTYLDALPGRNAVVVRLRHLLRAESPEYKSLQVRGSHIFALYSDPAKEQPALVRLNANGDPSSRTGVLDPNLLDGAGHIAIDWYVASPDGLKVAVSLSRNGSEDGTLYVFDALTGAEIGKPIDRVQYATAGGALAWAGDNRGFWYTRYPGAGVPASERHFNVGLYFHELDSDISADARVLSGREGLPRTAEIFLDNAEGGASALASVQLGDGGRWQHYVLLPDRTAVQIGRYEDLVIGGATIGKDGTVFGVSRRNAPMGKVVKLSSPYAGGFANAPTIVPEQPRAAIIDGGEFSSPLTLAADRLYVSRIIGGPSKVTIYDLSGGRRSDLALPPVSSVPEIDALPSGGALYKVSTYLEPPYFMRWNAQSQRGVRTALATTAAISFRDAQVQRIFAISNDGTKVPITVMSRKDLKLDGNNPVLIRGYGGYGISLTPEFAGARARLWLNAGGVYAIANIRGGGEYGQRWHEQGMLTNKQNVFDDFAAAANVMVTRGYTSHEKLALIGGSNGGLLMGAEIVQHPQIARVVVSAVGIYDMMRVELDPNGAFNVSEYGTVTDPLQFKALYSYSPYHNVRPRTGYPAVLMLTGANDGRVDPLHSRKFTAALQAATISRQPILLRTSTDTGHGMGSSMDDHVFETTDVLMFLFDRLGMDAIAAAK